MKSLKKTAPMILILLSITSFFYLSAGEDPDQKTFTHQQILEMIEKAYNFCRQDPQHALSLADKALTLALKMDFESGIARANNRLGLAYYYLGNLEKSLLHYLKALDINEKLHDHRGMIADLNNIGLVYKDLDKNNISLEYYLKALKISEEIKNISTAQILNNIGVAYRHLGQTSRSLNFYNQALKANRKDGNVPNQALNLNNIGLIHFDRGENDEAFKYISEALKINRRITNKYETANNLTNLVNILIKTGELEKAEKLLAEAQVLIEEISAPQLRLNNLKSKALLFEKKNDFKKAYHAMWDQTELYREITKQQIHELHTRYDLQKKDQEKELLLKEKKIKETQFLVLHAAIISLIIFIFLIIRFYIRIRKTNKIMNRQRREIKELDHFKEALTGMIVHDMKNHLNAVLFFSGEKHPQSLELIQDAGQQMQIMIMNILDVQKFEAAEMKVIKQLTSCFTVVNQAANQVRFLVNQKNITLQYGCQENLQGNLDPDLIKRVLVNLLTNAIQFTPERGKITINCKKTNQGFVMIMVRDTGGGISTTDLPHLFDKFYQVKDRGARRIGSTGLGLTFCKLAVEAHGGTIGVNNKDSGAEFWFKLPATD